MNKRPILVAFSNQKGGVGKSTVTAVLASYFNYVRGLKVAVVDCDYPQFSLEKLRGRDLQNLEKSEYHQRLFCRQFEDGSRKAYPIVTSTPEAAAEIPGKLEGDYDLIFFDLPGTVNSRGVFESVMNMDFIFTPIVKDRMVMQSSLSFVSTVQEFHFIQLKVAFHIFLLHILLLTDKIPFKWLAHEGSGSLSGILVQIDITGTSHHFCI